ncbi:MAG TPA: DUF3515 domain-containing protein [Nocardioidaceae bacterium]
MACLGSALLLSSCGGPVEVEAPRLTGADERTCRRLVQALPDSVDDAERVEVDPPEAPAGAWGDPPIVLRCGVPMPEDFDDYATCHETNGIGWFIPDEQMSGEATEITMTTIGRDVNVEVTLPPEHWPPANAMVDLSEAIDATTDEVDPCV